MSCNYYIHTKDAEMAFDLAPRVDIDADERKFIIHLCQTAIGWKTLFESHSYFSFQELVDILRNPKYSFVIKDEYDREIDKEEFISDMMSRQKNDKNKSRVGSPCERSNQSVFSDSDGYEFASYDFS